MEKIKSLIWYATIMLLMIGLYYVGRTYSIGMIEDFRLMEPVIKPNSMILIKKGTSVIRNLKRDDIIVYWRTLDGKTSMRIAGRIAALPGQIITVNLKEKRVYVDGVSIANAPAGIEVLETGIIIPRDTAFVMFDSPPQIEQRVGPHAYFVRFSDIEGRVTR